MAKIKIMKEVLANKIAAGEVIERPLSVVKELVENSLDSGATRIKIELKDSGIKQIVITDNGSGMSEADLPLAIKRHATSKLYDDKDLFKISTLGFRGEALPSIYAVSQISIASSVDGIGGKKLVKLDDENFEIESVAMNKGTIIEIDNLFYNTPVRYKHLSNPFYELSITIQYINKLTLIHPDVSFELSNNGNQLIKTRGDGDIRAIMSEQYSPSIAKSMMSFKAENSHFEIELYTSHPHDTRSRKSHITIGLNSRLIRNYEIENKIIDSYGTFLHTGQFPISFINIKVNYSLIDVNIHPTKQQVKISLIDNLLDLIESNIKTELGKLTYMAEPVEIKNENYSYQARLEQTKSQVEAQLDQLFEDVSPSTNTDLAKVAPMEVESNHGNLNHEVKASDNLISTNFSKETIAPIFKANSDNVSRTDDLFSMEADENKIDVVQKLPLFNFVGTLHNTYILCENGDGLYLIDQHAAQERINYELIFDSFKNKQFIYQQSLMPIIITLSESESVLFDQHIEQTEDFGFKIERFGINSYKVTEIDSWLSKRKHAEEDIHEIVNLIIDKQAKSFEQYYDELAISMACKKSIKAHQRVNQTEAEALLRELNLTRQPYTCPHGRPVIVKITTKEIEKMFKRVF